MSRLWRPAYGGDGVYLRFHEVQLAPVVDEYLGCHTSLNMRATLAQAWAEGYGVSSFSVGDRTPAIRAYKD